ncbi:MAG: polysaccharide biosynthesis tyrosine autokinase [Veillonella sp.]|nr:MAG: polysaccharide biosynthesis tyrosine autokinase [Veillonella sp.]
MDTIRLISNEYGDTPLVESYRTLRSNLQYRCNAENRKMLCVTSATTGEGVSEVAANLAISLSKNNDKVLLIDGNLRNPVQHVVFDVKNQGLTNHIIMDEDLTIHRHVMPHLDLITSGIAVESPSEVVDSHRLSTVFEYIRDEYDVIIVDTPSVLSVTDALVIAEKAAGVLLVVKGDYVQPDDMALAKQRLEQIGVPIIGSVFIDME